MYPEQQIRTHAETHLAGRGVVSIKNIRRESGCFSATVIITTETQREYYNAYCDYGAVGMVLSLVETLPPLALFAMMEPKP